MHRNARRIGLVAGVLATAATLGLGLTAPAALGATNHSITVGASDVEEMSGVISGGAFVEFCGSDFGDVGYVNHNGDFGHNDCLNQVATRFDVSALHQYPGAVPTRAILTHTESIVNLAETDGTSLLGNDGQPMIGGNPTCIDQIVIPGQDWRGTSDLIAGDTDTLLTRLDNTTWDVTNEVAAWYSFGDQRNFGLVFQGYETGYTNNSAQCMSGIGNFQLKVDFAADDPTPKPFGSIDPNKHVFEIPTPKPIGSTGIEPNQHVFEIATPIPSPTPRPGAPDLVVGNILIQGSNVTTPDNYKPQACVAGSNTVTVIVANGGLGPAPAFSTTFTIDGKLIATVSTPGMAGPTNNVGPSIPLTFLDVQMKKGTHMFSATVDPGNLVPDLDRSNNTFTVQANCN